MDHQTNITIPTSECRFGPAAPKLSTFEVLDQNFNISYGDGECLNGHVGYETVSFAGIETKIQKVGLAYLAGWFGDTVSSGLVGLAFPSVTSVYDGSDLKKDVASTTRHPNATSNQRLYLSLMNTMFFEQNLTDPIFALALSRDGVWKMGGGYGGLIEIGGMLDLKSLGINASTDFVSTGMQILERQWINPLKPAHQFYTIGVDSFVYKSSKSKAGTQYVVGSGTTLVHLPSAEAAAINALFVPPARNVNGNSMVQCNAKAPTIEIKVNGTTLAINPVEVILKANERGT
ncbi:acid protease [Acephala macrosclerotiorum]|nr:acid protease [Acephala macrosclerotiorum]